MSDTLIHSEGEVFRAEPYSEEEFAKREQSGDPIQIFETDRGFFMGSEKVNSRIVALFGQEALRKESTNQIVDEDPDQADWNTSAQSAKDDTPAAREKYREACRYLAKWHPNARAAIRLYRNYVAGKELKLEIEPVDDSEDDYEDEDRRERWAAQFMDFLRVNSGSYSMTSHVVRTYRDGEAFVWGLPESAWDRDWPPRVAFLRPEEIADPNDKDAANQDHVDYTHGIITDPNDIYTVRQYLRVKTRGDAIGTSLPPIPADQVIHTKIDCDEDELRGNPRLLPVIKPARQIEGMVDTELVGRKLQASVVLQKKVAGGPNAVRSVSDNARTSTSNYSSGSMNREKVRPGTIVTTGTNVEYAFLTPDTNFSDASPLARQILLQISAATGWPEYMITGDASNGNLASALVQEGPVVKMVQDEQEFFAKEFEKLFRWYLKLAIEKGVVEDLADMDEFDEKYRITWNFPVAVTRDNLKDRQADNLSLMGGVISRTQAMRNLGVKPAKMKREMKEEMDELPAMGNGLAAMNPSMADKQDSSAANAQDGSGTNQGDSPIVQHDDRTESEGYVAPEGAKAEAKRGLEWRQEFGRGGTAVGVARARDISGGKSLSADTIGRMVSFFARHEVDKQGTGWSPGEEGYPSNGRIAWALWGGDAGRAWANKVYDSFEDAE